MPELDLDSLGSFLRAIEERLPGGHRLVSFMLAIGSLAFIALCLSVIAPVVDAMFRRVTGARTAWPTITLGELLVLAGVFGGTFLFSRVIRRRISEVSHAVTEALSQGTQAVLDSTEAIERSTKALTAAQEQLEVLKGRIDNFKS
jgi:hypothetical protein